MTPLLLALLACGPEEEAIGPAPTSSSSGVGPVCGDDLSSARGVWALAEDHRYAMLLGQGYADDMGYGVACADDLAGPMPRAWAAGAPELTHLDEPSVGWVFVVDGGTRGEVGPEEAAVVAQGVDGVDANLGITVTLGNLDAQTPVVFAGDWGSFRFIRGAGAAFGFDLTKVDGRVAADEAGLMFEPADYQAGTYRVLPVGDLDGDGQTDLLVAHPQLDNYDGRLGQLALYRGDDLQALNPIDAAARHLLDSSPTNLTGRSVAVGDVDGDGAVDLVHGEPDMNGFLSPGRVAVRLGPLLEGSPDAEPLGADIELLAAEVSEGSFGLHLEVADLDGDGQHDLVISDVTTIAGGLERTGQVYVWFGPLAPGSYAAEQADLIIDGYGPGEQLGRLGVGDHDGDGFADLLVAQGTHYANSGCPGRLHVFRGPLAPGRLHARDDADLLYDGDVPGVTLGLTLAACDLDGDGDDEIVVGEPDYIDAEGVARGRVQVLEGWDFAE